MGFTITTNKIQKQCLEKTAKGRKHNAEKVAVVTAVGTPDQNNLTPGIVIVWLKTADLKPAARLLRKISEARVAKAVQLIKHFGFVGPLIVRDGKIVDGHTRLEAAKELGLANVPCVDVGHLSAAKAKMLRISLNRFAETGEWDIDELKVELEELRLDGFDLTLSAFTDQELDILCSRTAESFVTSGLRRL